MEKILFLDIDGVLNSKDYAQKLDHPMVINGNGEFPDIDPEAMERLNYIIKETNCNIVLTSGWRYFPNIKEHLVECGLCKPVMDVTIVSDNSRAYEIYYYLLNTNCKQFVIVDDNDFELSKNFPFNFVQTSFQSGLTDILKEKIINKLK